MFFALLLHDNTQRDPDDELSKYEEKRDQGITEMNPPNFLQVEHLFKPIMSLNLEDMLMNTQIYSTDIIKEFFL